MSRKKACFGFAMCQLHAGLIELEQGRTGQNPISGLGGTSQDSPADLGGNGGTLKRPGEAAGLWFDVQAGGGRSCHAHPDRCLRCALVGRCRGR